MVHRQLTQAELLAEAARTEIENIRSLQYLVAIEEETKKKAHVRQGKYVGPMVRWESKKVGEEEKTTLEVRNMQAPPYLQPQKAPQPLPRAVCVITGEPAKYRDPVTGLAYANLEAYKELQARRQQQAVAAQAQRTYTQQHYGRQTQQQQQQQQYLIQQQQQQLVLQQQQRQQQQQQQQQHQFLLQQQQLAAAQMAAQYQQYPASFNQN